MKKIHSSRRMLLKSGLIIFLLGAGLCPAVFALDYLGADAVLRLADERNAQPNTNVASTNEQAQLRIDLKSFSQMATNLSPAEAAQRWLALADRAAKAQLSSRRNYDNQGDTPVQADDLLTVLPPPATWVELNKAIMARPLAKNGEEAREVGLHLLAVTLTGDTEGRKREITNLQAKAQLPNSQMAVFYRSFLQQLSQTMLEISDDPDAILKSLDRQLTGTGNLGYRRGQNVNVPNLVSQVGAEKAEAFLRKALVTPNIILKFNGANETSRLAQKLALELVAQLKLPQWGLVNSLDTVELYEALDQRFGHQTNNPAPASMMPDTLSDVIPPMEEMDNREKNDAQIYYLLGLISKGRAPAAVAVAKKINTRSGSYIFDEAFKAMGRAGYTTELDNFFYELLSQNPALPFWDQYVELAAKAGQTERMVTLVRTKASDADLSDNQKSALHQILFKALLAADNTEEAVVEIRTLIASTGSAADGNSSHYSTGQLGAMLARLGRLLNRPDWTDAGIAAAKKWLTTTDGQNFSDDNAEEVLDSTVQILFELQRGPEAETLLTDALTSATRPDHKQSQYEWNGPPAQHILAELAGLYHQAGRSGDVLRLLGQSSAWGAKDLCDLFETAPWDKQVTVMWLHTGSSPLPIPYLAANALMATGQKEAAQKIDDELLNRQPGLDRGYELLLALKGTNAIPRLDELFARDQFEERPLIWKAHLLKQQGKLEEAEKTIRQAVAIDPSDGEEGRGDRMRAYSELADIREARGDQKEAVFYREVVQAIRLSETADQFYLAGLLKRAIGMYEQALTHFSNAYCIQSRLAIQLSALGLNAEAETHYQRAFELMPDSFGRVESHCFGCEKAFDGERAQSIAEKVFTKFAAEHPDKPQIHYLLGYLNEEEEHFNAARTHYLEAVRLDSAYLNAWVRMQDISKNSLVSPKERDEMIFNILRLDPLQRHSHLGFERASNLPGLWNAVADALNRQLAPATNLFPLTASKIAMEKKKADKDAQNVEYRGMEMRGNNLSPAGAVAQTMLVQLAGQLIMTSNYGLDE